LKRGMTVPATIPRLIASTGIAAILTAAFIPATSASGFKVLYSFCAETNCTDGQIPWGDPMLDASGALYGTTQDGGLYAQGTIYELVQGRSSGKWIHNVLYDFCSKKECADGSRPHGDLIADAAGNLYGTTGGEAYRNRHDSIAFELLRNSGPARWNLKTLYRFCIRRSRCLGNYSDQPNGGLTYAGKASVLPYDGVSPLYGTTVDVSTGGSVYRLTPGSDGTWTESTIRYFCPNGEPSGCPKGSQPEPDLILGADGNLYGTTFSGGTNLRGVAFALDPQTGSETVLHNFCADAGCADGGPPSSGLLMDESGNLYGEAEGGTSPYCPNCGVIFKIVPGSGSYTVMHAFCQKPDCRDGGGPFGGLTMDASGNLLGVAMVGGGHDIDVNHVGGGIAFSLGASLTVLHRFCSKDTCTDGEYPVSRLIQDASGAYFGVTSQGGAYGYGYPTYGGTVYEIAP